IGPFRKGRTPMSAKYAVLFALLAAVPLVAAFAAWPALGPIALLFAWPALSFVLLAVAYGGGGAAFLLQRPPGRPGGRAWALYPPYSLLNALVFRLYRATAPGPAFAQVVPGLYFGRRLTTAEAAALAPAAVLDLAAEFGEPQPLRKCGAYRSLPVLD